MVSLKHTLIHNQAAYKPMLAYKDLLQSKAI